MKTFGLSDIGLSRENNEDVWLACPEIGFFAIADGMGGHRAGEIAAKEAVEHLFSSIKKVKSHSAIDWMIQLRYAIEKANQWVYLLGQNNDHLNGMGTTLCCLVWIGEAIVYAHVGDSRIYRMRKNKLELLTQDHSLFAKWLQIGKESQTPYPYKNVITRAIGTGSRANPEIAISTYEPGDLFFLCTDGLSDVLSLEDLEKMINNSKNLEEASKKLIEEAKIKGSSDNITVLMIQSEQKSAKNLSRQQRYNSSRSPSLQSDAFGSGWTPCEPF
jgi:serine/threonine protein phosphatase PrpC